MKPIVKLINSKLFVLSFEDDAHRRSHKGYVLPSVEIEDYNILID